MEFRIPPKSTSIAQLFSVMEKTAKNNITDWAVTQLGLDSIFQTIVAQSNREKFNENIENVGFEEDTFGQNNNNNNFEDEPEVTMDVSTTDIDGQEDAPEKTKAIQNLL